MLVHLARKLAWPLFSGAGFFLAGESLGDSEGSQPSSFSWRGQSAAKSLPAWACLSFFHFPLSGEKEKKKNLRKLPSCACWERELWMKPSLGLTNHSLCRHQKAQRSREADLAPVATLKPKALQSNAEMVCSPLFHGLAPARKARLTLLPYTYCLARGFGSSAPLSRTDRAGSCLTCMAWQQLDMTSFLKIAPYAWISPINIIPLSLTELSFKRTATTMQTPLEGQLSTRQGSANFFWECPDGRYFRFCGPHSLRCNCNISLCRGSPIAAPDGR